MAARWLSRGTFPSELLEDVPANAFVREVLLGIARHKRLLEWTIARFSRNRCSIETTAFLMVGLYQILLMDDIPPHAAVNETVAGARAQGATSPVAGYINAILRRACREQSALRAEIAGLPLAVRESHPDELVKRWMHHYGEKGAEALCQWNNTRPEVCIVATEGRVTAAELLDRLTAAGITVTPHPAEPDDCLVLPRGISPRDLPGYGEGLFTVQDPSTLLAVELLDPRPGERILDACAAPGGKSIRMALRVGSHGRVIAMDVKASRLARLEENVRRMGVAVDLWEGDATALTREGMEPAGAPFHAVLVDAPCTNTGVLRRRPDARWRFSATRLARLNAIQRALLDSAGPCVAPGGRLVYSTCSLEPEENSGLVAAWLEATPQFTLIEERTCWPPEARTDGAYAALLVRR